MARVLLLDDEQTILTVLSTLLRAKGHEATTASVRDQAESLIKAGEYDLLVSDVRMQDFDGLEMLALSKQEHPNIPVLMCTAYLTPQKVDMMRKNGAFDCLKKPFDMPEMFAMLDRALAAGAGSVDE